MSQDMVLVNQDRYLARKKIFSFLGQAFHIYDTQQNLCFYVKQKGFKLKEAITVYRDESKNHPVMTIQARSIMDFSGTYDVTDVQTGQVVGALQRQGMKSMFRDEWHIIDAQGAVIGKVIEDSMALAMVRRFLSNLIPQGFTVTIGEREVASFQQNFNPFVAKYDIDMSNAEAGGLDKRLGIAAVVLLLAIEGKQN